MDKQQETQPLNTFGPYSPVRKHGTIYYISGQVGVNPNTHTASESVSEQTDQTLQNLGTALASAGLTYNDIVKTTLYLTDMDTFDAVNEVYVGYFNEPRPARTTIGVSSLPRVAGDTKLVFEMDAIAVKAAS
jgi:2-iminobutanoate/2-iminopropanoate deaminase